jgi:hypothetical protein
MRILRETFGYALLTISNWRNSNVHEGLDAFLAENAGECLSFANFPGKTGVRDSLGFLPPFLLKFAFSRFARHFMHFIAIRLRDV